MRWDLLSFGIGWICVIILYKILFKPNTNSIKKDKRNIEYNEMNNHIDNYNNTINKKLLECGIIVNNPSEVIDKLIELTNNHTITWNENDIFYHSRYNDIVLTINKYDNILLLDFYLKFSDINMLVFAIKNIEPINENTY